MPLDVRVIVRTDGRRIRDVVRSLDTQSLAADRFDVVLVGDTEDPASVERLAGRRTNVRIGGAEEPLGAAADGGPEAGYVLELGATQQLLPDALERLVDYAETHQLDAVAGRQVQLSRPLSSLYAQDRAELHGAEAAEALASPVVLRRRSRLSVEDGQLRFDDAGARVGVQTQYPVAVDTEGEAAPALPITVDRPRLAWRDQDLVVDVSGTVTAEEQEELVPILLVRQLGTFASYLLPTEGSVAAAPGAGGLHRGWTASTTFSPLNAAAGGPLSRGEWQLDVVIAGPQAASVPTRLPGAVLPVALLDDLAIAPVERRSTLFLDVGPARQPLIGKVSAEDAEVVESAAGSIIRIALPSWHVATSRRVSGFIALRGLRLPAVIETESGNAVLVAFVSGLAGSYPISASFGRPPLQPIGLNLEVSGTGLMRVAAAEPAAPARPKVTDDEKRARRRRARRRKQRAARRADAKAKSTRKPKGPLAKVRAAIPSSWEPQIRRIARIPVLRRTYRRLTGQTRQR